jgi:hypothetical protein
MAAIQCLEQLQPLAEEEAKVAILEVPATVVPAAAKVEVDLAAQAQEQLAKDLLEQLIQQDPVEAVEVVLAVLEAKPAH